MFVFLCNYLIHQDPKLRLYSPDFVVTIVSVVSNYTNNIQSCTFFHITLNLPFTDTLQTQKCVRKL